MNLSSNKTIKIKIIELIKQQHRFLIKILKYNKFWSEFYLSVIIHFLPANLICLQQSLFGHLSFEFRIIFIISNCIGTISIVPSSLFVCLLAKDMKVYSKQLYRLQFASNLNLNVKTKIKVSIEFKLKLN